MTSIEPIGEGTLPSLESWLTDHPDVANAICWEKPIPPGTFQRIYAYTQWSQDQKQQLHNFYAEILSRSGPVLQDPPPNGYQAAGDELVQDTLISRDYAWPLYLAHVAQTLTVEIARWVPWSITTYTDEQLRILLDSRSFFTWRSGDHYAISFVRHGCVVPAPPAFMFSFLARTIGLAATPRLMVARLLEWCRERLQHMSNGFTAENLLAFWQYAGWPPVSRIVNGTVNSAEHPELGHYTAGCWGTSGFLRAVLRTVNIPVVSAMIENFSDAITGFPTLSLYLSHGDDPYNMWNLSHPRWSSDEFFIDEATYLAWFGPEVSLADKEGNVSRRPVDLALYHLPYYLLAIHCADLFNLRGPAESLVYNDYFKFFYTLEQLEAMNLWERLDAKLTSLGGCRHVPRDDIQQGHG
jgi:hypothetical protein